MKQCRLEVRQRVRKVVDQLPGHLRQRIKRVLQELRTNPRPANAEAMRGQLAGCYKISLGVWRLVY